MITSSSTLALSTTAMGLGLGLGLGFLVGPTPIAAAAATGLASNCHGQVCQAIEEYCSAFIEGCDKCSNICDANSHNYHADMCARECAEYNKYDPLKAEIHTIQVQQRTILLLLIVLLALIAIRYGFKCVRWLRHKGCIGLVLKKLSPKGKHHTSTQAHTNGNVKDLGGTTIQNMMAMVTDIERAPSQIYSVTGAEGSIMTTTTPVSTRYPAENSTPTNVAAEYSYDNEALAVTPVSEKQPVTAQGF